MLQIDPNSLQATGQQRPVAAHHHNNNNRQHVLDFAGGVHQHHHTNDGNATDLIHANHQPLQQQHHHHLRGGGGGGCGGGAVGDDNNASISQSSQIARMGKAHHHHHTPVRASQQQQQQQQEAPWLTFSNLRRAICILTSGGAAPVDPVRLNQLFMQCPVPLRVAAKSLWLRCGRDTRCFVSQLQSSTELALSQQCAGRSTFGFEMNLSTLVQVIAPALLERLEQQLALEEELERAGGESLTQQDAATTTTGCSSVASSQTASPLLSLAAAGGASSSSFALRNQQQPYRQLPSTAASADGESLHEQSVAATTQQTAVADGTAASASASSFTAVDAQHAELWLAVTNYLCDAIALAGSADAAQALSAIHDCLPVSMWQMRQTAFSERVEEAAAGGGRWNDDAATASMSAGVDVDTTTTNGSQQQQHQQEAKLLNSPGHFDPLGSMTAMGGGGGGGGIAPSLMNINNSDVSFSSPTTAAASSSVAGGTSTTAAGVSSSSHQSSSKFYSSSEVLEVVDEDSCPGVPSTTSQATVQQNNSSSKSAMTASNNSNNGTSVVAEDGTTTNNNNNNAGRSSSSCTAISSGGNRSSATTSSAGTASGSASTVTSSSTTPTKDDDDDDAPPSILLSQDNSPLTEFSGSHFRAIMKCGLFHKTDATTRQISRRALIECLRAISELRLPTWTKDMPFNEGARGFIGEMLAMEYSTPFVDYFNNKNNNSNGVVSQSHLTAKMRVVLVDWLHAICTRLRMSDHTFHLNIALLDIALTVHNDVSTRQLQLLGIAAMLLASKYHEINPPPVKDFVYMSANAYTCEDILGAERFLFSLLDCRVTFPSLLDTADLILSEQERDAPVSPEQRAFVHFMLHTHLHFHIFGGQGRCITAARAAVFLSKVMYDVPMKACAVSPGSIIGLQRQQFFVDGTSTSSSSSPAQAQAQLPFHLLSASFLDEAERAHVLTLIDNLEELRAPGSKATDLLARYKNAANKNTFGIGDITIKTTDIKMKLVLEEYRYKRYSCAMRGEVPDKKPLQRAEAGAEAGGGALVVGGAEQRQQHPHGRQLQHGGGSSSNPSSSSQMTSTVKSTRTSGNGKAAGGSGAGKKRSGHRVRRD